MECEAGVGQGSRGEVGTASLGYPMPLHPTHLPSGKTYPRCTGAVNETIDHYHRGLLLEELGGYRCVNPAENGGGGEEVEPCESPLSGHRAMGS